MDGEQASGFWVSRNQPGQLDKTEYTTAEFQIASDPIYAARDKSLLYLQAAEQVEAIVLPVCMCACVRVVCPWSAIVPVFVCTMSWSNHNAHIPCLFPYTMTQWEARGQKRPIEAEWSINRRGEWV